MRRILSENSRGRRKALLLLPALVLAGCQGGGSEPLAEDPTPTDTGIPAFLSTSFVESFDSYTTTLARQLINSTPRYLRQKITWSFTAPPSSSYSTYPLASSKAHYAHAAGLTGAGSTIAFTDAGFLPTHEALSGHSIITATNVGIASHGTGVASVAAGNSASMIGIAPEADLILGSFNTAASRTEVARLAAENGAVALNNSWGFTAPDGGTVFATSANYATNFATAADTAYLSALRTYAQNGVAVFAVSNLTDDANTSLLAGLPLFEPSLEEGWLAVINAATTRNDTQILTAERLSAGCLESAQWCLAAEGAWEAATAISNTSYDLSTGTSLATPMVSGALALLQEAFPTLTPHQLRTRLLASADQGFSGFTSDGTTELADGFIRYYSDEWGLGFLDIRAALLPIGETGIAMANGTLQNTATPLMRAGSATGDAVIRSLGGQTVLVSDALGGDFSVAASDLVAQPVIRDAVTRLNNRLFDGGSLALLPEIGASAGFWLNETTRMGFTLPSQDESASWGITLQKQFDGLTLGATVANDSGTLLPTSGLASGTRIAALEIGFNSRLTSTQNLKLGFLYGSTLGSQSVSGAPEGMTFNSLSLTGTQSGILRPDDTLNLSLALPAALASGTTSLTLPTARSASGALQYTNIPIDLRPDDREINASITYRRPAGEHGDYYIGALHAVNSGNISGARDTALLAGFHVAF